MLRYAIGTERVIIRDKKYNFDYVLIKQFHDIKKTEIFYGDTLYTNKKKDYSIHLLKDNCK